MRHDVVRHIFYLLTALIAGACLLFAWAVRAVPVARFEHSHGGILMAVRSSYGADPHLQQGAGCPSQPAPAKAWPSPGRLLGCQYQGRRDRPYASALETG